MSIADVLSDSVQDIRTYIDESDYEWSPELRDIVSRMDALREALDRESLSLVTAICGRCGRAITKDAFGRWMVETQALPLVCGTTESGIRESVRGGHKPKEVTT